MFTFEATVVVIVVVSVFLGTLDYLWRREFNLKLHHIKGPFNLPFIGPVWIHFGKKSDELLDWSKELQTRYGRTIKLWIFHIPAIFTSDLNYIQTILSHSSEIRKNRMYSLFNSWLGDGLLVSYGTKWWSRRHVITPAFHFKILENFVQIFDQQAVICSKKLTRYALETDQEPSAEQQQSLKSQYVVNIEHIIGLATLDVICESAMGVQINAQTDEHCEYVRLLAEMQEIFLKRFVNVAYRTDRLFRLTAPYLARKERMIVEELHNFTENIIQERRKKMREKQSHIQTTNPTDRVKDSEVCEKKKEKKKTHLAFLDILLSTTIDGVPLTDNDIREEVDTFMFEGHDTTKSAIGFTLYALSREQHVQAKVYSEIREILGPATQPLTLNKLQELKYMEKVIKEALRKYPPVPFIGRQMTQNCSINDLYLPKDTSIMLSLISMQNDAEYYPEPTRFLPERPAHPNAFALVPFSAGPRNCIGQRFAILEIKAFLTRILQTFELLPLGSAVEPTLSIVLKSKTGWQMGFRKR